MDFEEIIKELSNIHYPSPLTYNEIQKREATRKIDDNELEAIYHLTESHSPSFRCQATMLYEKSLQESTSKCSVPLVKDSFKFNCSNDDIKVRVATMLDHIEEMPKEWTLVQLTSSFDAKQSIELGNWSYGSEYCTPSLYLTRFSCGQSRNQPFTIFLDKPKDNEGQDIKVKHAIKQVLNEEALNYKNYKNPPIRRDLNAFYRTRTDLNSRMREIVRIMQDRWLSAWRVLFLGTYNDELETTLDLYLNSILLKNKLTKIPAKSKQILKCLCRGYTFLDMHEIKIILKYALPGVNLVTMKNVISGIESSCVVQSTTEKRNPVILIIEESLDSLPWEMIDVMSQQASSRMLSLHFTYALYKEHEVDIVDGWKTNINPKNGGQILNPQKDLLKMERRLSSFFRYWLPEWKIIKGREPTHDEFLEQVMKHDIFCYNGHGNGFQFCPPKKIQKLRINAVVLLFGCSSVQLKEVGPKAGYYGSFLNYITACSPCIVGMLWTVTDSVTDLLSTDFISQWVPSDAPTHWSNLVNTKWLSGDKEIDPNTLPKVINLKKCSHEPELQTALLKAKKAVNQYLTAAAVVSRGIPVKMGVN